MKLILAALSAALLFAAPVAAQEVKAKPAGDAAPMMVVDTATFLKVATGSNEFEIASSRIALEKGSAQLKALANMIIADHAAADEELKTTLEGKGATFTPAPPAPKQQKMLKQLEAAEGAEFDTLYLDVQAQAHMEAVALFRTYAGSGDDQAVVGFARETLPRLETHMGQVTQLIAAQ